ncbi:hypothetical protein V8C26DRAFT_409852, partial [Trichoderma gracile]
MHRRRACPVCRLEVDCEQCGGFERVVHHLPVTGIAAKCAEFPRTMAEGGRWPSRCNHCMPREERSSGAPQGGAVDFGGRVRTDTEGTSGFGL